MTAASSPGRSATRSTPLYLQNGSSSTGSWTDIPGAASTLYSSVEEVNYTAGAGWYRWRAYSYSGSGSFSICYQKPV